MYSTFPSTSTRGTASADNAGNISIRTGTNGSGLLQFAGDITATAAGSGNGGNINIENNSTSPFVVENGHIFARARGAGSGGEISVSNQQNSVNVKLNSTVSANSVSGTDGSIVFNKSSLTRDVVVNGTGALEGNLVVQNGGNVDINLAGQNDIVIKDVQASGSKLSIAAPSLGSKITLLSSSTLANTGGAIALKAPQITNDAQIKALNTIDLSSDTGLKLYGAGSLQTSNKNGEIRISSAPGQTLTLGGTQTFNPGSSGTVTWTSLAPAGFINLLDGANQAFTPGASLKVNTPHLALRANVNLLTSGGSITIDGGDSDTGVKVSALNGSNTTIISTGGNANIDITGKAIVFAGSAIKLDTSSTSGNGGKITLLASDGNIVNNTPHLSFDSSGSIGGDISITAITGPAALGVVNLNHTDFKANTLNGSLPTSAGGTINISAGKAVTLSGPIESTSNQKGGAISISGSSIVAADDLPVSPPLRITATGQTGGGSITLTATSGNINLSRFNAQFGATGDNGNGGSLELNAANGAIVLNGDIHADGKGTGDGGSIKMTAQSFNFGTGGNVTLTADAGSDGFGGKIEVNATNSNLFVGVNNGKSFLFSVLGSSNSNGGEIRVTSAKNLTYAGGINSKSFLGTTTNTASRVEFSAGENLSIKSNIQIVDNGDKGNIILTGNAVSINKDVNITAQGDSDQRSILINAISGAGTPSLVIGDNATISTFDNSRGSPSNGGIIQLTSAGNISTGSLTIDSSGFSSDLVVPVCERGQVLINASGAFIANGNLTINNTGTVNGANHDVSITAANVNFAGGSVSINASTSRSATPGNGNAGDINIKTTQSGLYLGSNVSLNAGSGISRLVSSGADGGNVNLTSAANLTIEVAQLRATAPEATDGAAVRLAATGTITVGGSGINAGRFISFKGQSSDLAVTINAPILTNDAIAFGSSGSIVVTVDQAGVLSRPVFVGQLDAEGNLGSNHTLAGPAASVSIDVGVTRDLPIGTILSSGDVYIRSHTISSSGASSAVIDSGTKIDFAGTDLTFTGTTVLTAPVVNFGSTVAPLNTLTLIGEGVIGALQPAAQINCNKASSTVNIYTGTMDVQGNAVFRQGDGNLNISASQGITNTQLIPPNNGLIEGGSVHINGANVAIKNVDVRAAQLSIAAASGVSLRNTQLTSRSALSIEVGGGGGAPQTVPTSVDTLEGSDTIFLRGTGITVTGVHNQLSSYFANQIVIDSGSSGTIELKGFVEIFSGVSFTDGITSAALSRWILEDFEGLGSKTLKLYESRTKTGTFSLLGEGEIVLQAQKAMTLTDDLTSIDIRKGAILQIQRIQDEIRVRNLSDSKSGSLRISLETSPINIQPGHEAIVSKNKLDGQVICTDGLGRRRVRVVQSVHSHLVCTEFSFPSLVSLSPVLKFLRKSGSTTDHRIYFQIAKTAACLSLVTSSHGPFMQMRNK